MSHFLSLYALFKSEHSLGELFINIVSADVRVVGVGMMTVVEFNDVKPAAVYVEMDIALLEIRRNSFPDLYFGVQLLDFTPRGIAYALTVYLRRHKQYFKIAAFAVCRYYNSSDFFSVMDYAICLAAVDGMQNIKKLVLLMQINR